MAGEPVGRIIRTVPFCICGDLSTEHNDDGHTDYGYPNGVAPGTCRLCPCTRYGVDRTRLSINLGRPAAHEAAAHREGYLAALAAIKVEVRRRDGSYGETDAAADRLADEGART